MSGEFCPRSPPPPAQNTWNKYQTINNKLLLYWCFSHDTVMAKIRNVAKDWNLWYSCTLPHDLANKTSCRVLKIQRSCWLTSWGGVWGGEVYCRRWPSAWVSVHWRPPASTQLAICSCRRGGGEEAINCLASLYKIIFPKSLEEREKKRDLLEKKLKAGWTLRNHWPVQCSVTLWQKTSERDLLVKLCAHHFVSGGDRRLLGEEDSCGFLGAMVTGHV